MMVHSWWLAGSNEWLAAIERRCNENYDPD